jgi:hypothetical protein
MDPHLAEVLAEARFKERPDRIRQRVASAPKGANAGLYSGTDACSRSPGRLPLDVQSTIPLFLFLGLLADLLAGPNTRLLDALKLSRICHPHHSVGNPVSLPLIYISRMTDRQFGLGGGTSQQFPHSPIADGLLQTQHRVVGRPGRQARKFTGNIGGRVLVSSEVPLGTGLLF